MFQQKNSTPLPSLITKRKKKQADRSRGKNKRYKPEREPLDLDVLDETSEKLDDIHTYITFIKVSCRSSAYWH